MLPRAFLPSAFPSSHQYSTVLILHLPGLDHTFPCILVIICLLRDVFAISLLLAILPRTHFQRLPKSICEFLPCSSGLIRGSESPGDMLLSFTSLHQSVKWLSFLSLLKAQAWCFFHYFFNQTASSSALDLKLCQARHGTIERGRSIQPYQRQLSHRSVLSGLPLWHVQ